MNNSLAWVEIDLEALRHNYNEARRLGRLQLEPGFNRDIDILSVVKADAYGHGMLEAVKNITKEGGTSFAVSNLDEALSLRRAFPKVRILMFEACLPNMARDMVQHRIIPALGSLALVQALDRAARQAKKLVPIHIEVDTGMGRLGVWHEEVPAIVERILKLKNVYIEGFMTHFPVADTDRRFTEDQIEAFSGMVAGLIKDGVPFRYLHAANSMGLAAYKNRYFNIARPGVMLYGLYPGASLCRKVDLRPVMSVKARVLFTKTIHKGRGISYGHTFQTSRDTNVAIVSLGYSDGYRREFSNKAHVLVNGTKCRVLGRVTMDQTMVDISRAGDVRIGDDVVVLGRQGNSVISMDELADWAGTIHYEVACNLGNRLPRKYKS